jgi:hypothetical protein
MTWQYWGAQLEINHRSQAWLRTSPSDSAIATAIVSAWTSKPKNRNFSFMTGSLPLVALSCASLQTHSLTYDQRIGAGHSIMTVVNKGGLPNREELSTGGQNQASLPL